MMLKFKEYLQKINEDASALKLKDFSFSTWLLETVDPAARGAARAKILSTANEEILKKAELIMDLVSQKLFKHWPIWRPFYSKMPPIASFGAGSVDRDGIGTMCTTGAAIYYCPKFVVEQYELAKTAFASQFKDGVPPNVNLAIRTGARHPMDYALFVIIHEILHCSLKHHLRMPNYESEYISAGESAYLWNIAADYEINHLLLDDTKASLYEMVPGGVRADQGGFAVAPEEREFFTQSDAETIFWKLVRNIEAKRAKADEDKAEDDAPEDGESDEESTGAPGAAEPGEGSEGGDGEGSSDSETPLKPGDVIYDRTTGEYGVVSRVEGDNLEFDPISEEEARKRIKK